jgi:predicted O-linked N-acetylglucosamine transferase (SPINDLY family)
MFVVMSGLQLHASEASAADLFRAALEMHRRGETCEAKSLYKQVVASGARNAQAMNLLGLIYAEEGAHADAVEVMALAREIDAHNPHALNNLGVSLRALRRTTEAIGSYDAALAIKPDLRDALRNRGNAHCDMGMLQKAAADFRKVLAIDPEDAEAHQQLGHALAGLNRLDEAIASFSRALELRPDLEHVPGTLLGMRMQVCDWRGLPSDIPALVEGVLRGEQVTGPFPVLSLLDTPALHRRLAEDFASKVYPPIDDLGAIPVRPRGSGGRIRVGYFSADFHDHPVSYLIAGLLELHDRSAFEVIGFSLFGDAQSELRRRIIAGCDRFIDVSQKSDREVAQMSRDLGIDIAVNLGGYTLNSRTSIFARRAAPVQVSYIGYIGTMGAPYMDYILADRLVVPPGSECDYTEKIAYLPNSYQPNDPRRRISERQFTRAELGLPEAGFVYCCFNASYKILPAMFDAWMKILRAVPGSVLWLIDRDTTQLSHNLRREAEARGVDGNRLVFAKFIAPSDYLARYRMADLFLDTLPYNAGTTASDALWAGLPVLTCPGRSFAARMASSLLRAMDLPELIAPNMRDYVASAIRLGTDPSAYAEIKTQVARNRDITPLFDSGRFTRDLEEVYREMLRRHDMGLPPDVIDLETSPVN